VTGAKEASASASWAGFKPTDTSTEQTKRNTRETIYAEKGGAVNAELPDSEG
jgi:hypothetical protein